MKGQTVGISLHTVLSLCLRRTAVDPTSLLIELCLSVQKKRAGFLLFHSWSSISVLEEENQTFNNSPISKLSLSFSLSLFASMYLFVHLSLCPSVTKALMYLSLFFQIFFLCVCISASLFLYISLFHPLCLYLYPPLSLSPSNLSVCFCVCLPHSLFSSKPSVTLPTFQFIAGKTLNNYSLLMQGA